MSEESWGDYLKTHVIGDQCFSVAVAYSETGQMFDVASDDDSGWYYLYAEPQQIEVDGEVKTIDETTILYEVLQASETNKPPNAIWLGGKKYLVVNHELMSYNDEAKYPVTMFAKDKTGGAIVQGPSLTLIGLYSEDKNQTMQGCVGKLIEVCHVLPRC